MCINSNLNTLNAEAIIAILSILVTVLIGWQIFNVIFLEARIRGVRKKMEKKIRYKIAQKQCMFFSHFYMEIYNLLVSLQKDKEAVIRLREAIHRASESDDKEFIRFVCISLTPVVKSQITHLSTHDIHNIAMYLHQYRKLPEVKELLAVILPEQMS